jgi:hypothetical protein
MLSLFRPAFEVVKEGRILMYAKVVGVVTILIWH